MVNNILHGHWKFSNRT